MVELEGWRGSAKYLTPSPGRQSWECDAILFDLDGVLVDSVESIRRTWREWAAHHGLDVAAVMRAAQGRRTLETVQAVAPHLDLDRELEALAAAAARMDGVLAVPGARELLAGLPRGRWAVVTSADRATAEIRLRHVDLPVPPVLVAADQVGRGKPHPEGYLTAAAALGFPPAACLVVEDAPAGIEAARGGGMPVIGLATSHPAAALSAADAVVAALSSLQVTAGPRLTVTIA